MTRLKITLAISVMFALLYPSAATASAVENHADPVEVNAAALDDSPCCLRV